MADPQPNTTMLAVLGLVALQPGSGYDLARLAERSVGYLWTPSRSHIYKVLPRLVTGGLATAKRVRQRDRPDKILYSITPTGKRLLRRWLSEVDDEQSGDTNIFALKLFFCDLVPAHTARAQLDGYRRFLESRLNQFRWMSRTPSEGENIFPQLVLRRAIVRIEATLGWVEDVRKVLDPAQPDRDPKKPTRVSPVTRRPVPPHGAA
jgi:PadR family transcriptional regulator, regulatory protein AphA